MSSRTKSREVKWNPMKLATPVTSTVRDAFIDSKIPQGPFSTFISVLAHAPPHQISPRHRRATINDLVQKERLAIRKPWRNCKLRGTGGTGAGFGGSIFASEGHFRVGVIPRSMPRGLALRSHGQRRAAVAGDVLQLHLALERSSCGSAGLP